MAKEVEKANLERDAIATIEQLMITKRLKLIRVHEFSNYVISEIFNSIL